ncbi:synapsin-1-like isoform X3 [Cervus canadensis]|uniref:synapsin-1-like isoform X3 n=1 Tax=Cervus canadensis TaxID=1574408 RepID=UPI001C9E51C4|nr:synapsin-1-like isoform X3 [Cervus canadensis]
MAEDSRSDCGVHVPNPAESKGARSSGGLPGGEGCTHIRPGAPVQAGGLPPQTALPLPPSCRQLRPDASGQAQRAFTILAHPLAHGEAPLLGQASPGAHPGREAPHHQCRGEVSGCPLPRSGASVNTPASATSAAPPPRGQSASCTSVPPPASRKELTQQSCLSPCSQTLTFVVSSPRPAPGPRMHRAAPSGG